MKNKHLDEVGIQRYVLHKDDCDNFIIAHINHCQKCKAEVEIYELLFAAVKMEPNPVFEHDIANLVMKQLPEKQKFSLDKFLIVLLSGISISGMAIFIYLTNKYFPTVFSGVSSIQFSLIMATVLLISVFIYIDMKKNYNDQMNFS